jgi:NAD+ synthase
MPTLKELIDIDPESTIGSIVEMMQRIVLNKLQKRGTVIGVSGGLDSSVCLTLSIKAFGVKKVVGISMPETESNPESTELARELCNKFGIKFIIEDISEALSGFSTYKRRDKAIKNIFPEYDRTYKAKIVLPDNLLQKETLNVFKLTIISPEGKEKTKRIPLKEYLQIVAASNFKQRSRMSMLYYHAERLNYAVIGTGNKNEHEQGFFVKYGDGSADIKPIAHLFKTQVFQLAEYLNIPKEILSRTPTTDTYSAECTQEEFFFRVPFEIGDLVWVAMEKNIPAKKVSRELDLSEEQVIRIQKDIKRKIKTAAYLKAAPYHLE